MHGEDEVGEAARRPRRRGPVQVVVATIAVLVAVSALGLLIWALASPGRLAWLTSISNVLAVDLAAWTASAAMLAWVIRTRKVVTDGSPAHARTPRDLPQASQQGRPGADRKYSVDAEGVPAMQVGDGNTQIVYAHGRLAWTPVAAAQLPAPVAAFAGRGNELAELAELLNPAAVPIEMSVLALAGPPGVGKTALAVQAGHAAGGRGWFPGGTLFIDLHGYDSDSVVQPGEALDALLRALGVPAESIPPTVEERTAHYRSVLAANCRTVLLVIDNAASEDQVRPLRPGAGSHRMIVTSRRTLAGLENARLIDVRVLDEETAVMLLDLALRMARPEDDRVSNDMVAARRVAKFCEGLPLALQIIASLLKADLTLEVSQLAAELEVENLDRLRYDDGNTSAVSTVTAAFELSYRQLDHTSARLFRLLSAHPGPDASTAAIAALAGLPVGRTHRVLGGLAQAHLAEATRPADPRWRMHDLLRLYGRKLGDDNADADEREGAFDRLLGYFIALAAAADAHVRAVPGAAVPARFPDRDAALAWLDDERDSLVAAISMAADTGRDQAVIDLTASISLYLSTQRRYDEMLETAESALNATRRLGSKHGQASAFNNLGVALSGLRRFDDAMEAYHLAIALFKDLDDSLGAAGAATNLGSALREVRRFDDSVSHCMDAAAIYRDAGDRNGEANALNELGVVLRHMGRFEDAIVAHRDAITIYVDEGDRAAEAQATASLGNALDDAGRHEDAIIAHQESAAIYCAISDGYGEAIALNSLGSALRGAGRLQEAITAHQDVAARYRQMGDWYREGNALNNLGLALQADTRPGEAVAPFQDAVACYRYSGDRHREGIALGNLGLALLEAGRPEEAIKPSRDSVACFRDTGDRRRQGRALGNLGLALLLTGNLDEGTAISQEAVAIVLERGDQVNSKYPPIPGAETITIIGLQLPQPGE